MCQKDLMEVSLVTIVCKEELGVKSSPSCAPDALGPSPWLNSPKSTSELFLLEHAQVSLEATAMAMLPGGFLYL